MNKLLRTLKEGASGRYSLSSIALFYLSGLVVGLPVWFVALSLGGGTAARVTSLSVLTAWVLYLRLSHLD